MTAPGGGTPELLAPGGDLETSLIALEAGADAVYVGLKQFSARGRAKNLDISELRRLKTAAVAQGKRVYVAMNTVVPQSEWESFCELAWSIADAGVDAVILQDWGVLSWFRSQIPELEVHASTQMAVHNSPGARFLWKQGVKRVVLARELTLEEISEIHRQVPEVELEVFIHGALCYSVSGLCMASGLLLGRSANRGQCAQICRTWFETPKGKEYSLSTRDLQLGADILRLQKVGVRSLKIEGRMKSEDYVEGAVTYYRSVLEGSPDESALERSRLSFGRIATKGFLNEAKGENLLSWENPSTQGVSLGIVKRATLTGVEVKLRHSVSVHDGIRWNGEPGQGVRGILRGDQKVFAALKGEVVQLFLERLPEKGTELHLIKQQPDPLPRPIVPSPYQHPLEAVLTLEESRVSWVIQGFPSGVLIRGSQSFCLQASSSPEVEKWKTALAKGLAAPMELPWRLGSIRWENKTPWAGVFAPPSIWKELKRFLWIDVAEKIEQHRKNLSISAKDKVAPAAGPEARVVPAWGAFFQENDDELPSVIHLSPLQFDPAKSLDVIEQRLQAVDRPTLVVLENVGHLEAALRLAPNGSLSFVFGPSFHVANAQALSFLSGLLPRVQGLCAWQEGSDDTSWGGPKLIPRFLQEKAPAFLSRICLRRHIWAGSCHGCTGDWERPLYQNGRTWLARARGCMVEIRLREPNLKPVQVFRFLDGGGFCGYKRINEGRDHPLLACGNARRRTGTGSLLPYVPGSGSLYSRGYPRRT